MSPILVFCDNNQPYVIPFLYHFDEKQPKQIYLHGAHHSRALKLLRTGVPVCIEVTLLDGLVFSRTALNHSANYRSVMAFGKARHIADQDEKQHIFKAMTRRYFPGRTAGKDYSAATAGDLKATALLAVDIEQVSAKSRSGGPGGPLDRQSDAPGSAGVVEL